MRHGVLLSSFVSMDAGIIVVRRCAEILCIRSWFLSPKPSREIATGFSLYWLGLRSRLLSCLCSSSALWTSTSVCVALWIEACLRCLLLCCLWVVELPACCFNTPPLSASLNLYLQGCSPLPPHSTMFLPISKANDNDLDCSSSSYCTKLLLYDRYLSLHDWNCLLIKLLVLIDVGMYVTSNQIKHKKEFIKQLHVKNNHISIGWIVSYSKPTSWTLLRRLPCLVVFQQSK